MSCFDFLTILRTREILGKSKIVFLASYEGLPALTGDIGGTR